MLHRSRRPSRLAIALCLAGAVGAAHLPAHAAELGDARVLSHIGQQLVADIDLSMIEDPGTAVTVRLASPEVYGGAGIAMPPVLSSLNLSVMRRDGRQVLHVTSLRPVDADHLHLYLELGDKGQRTVRLATLWLTPDPHPAPAAAPVSAPAVVVPAPPLAPSPAPASAAVPSRAAAPVRMAPPAIAAPLPAAAPASGAPAAVAPATPAPVPALAAARRGPKALPPEGIAPPPRMHRIVPPIVAGKPLAALHAGHEAPSCARAADEAQLCTALGAKNAALREQLGKLEDKVKGLQAALGVTPGAAAAAAPAVEAAGGKAPAGAAAGAAPAVPPKTAAAPAGRNAAADVAANIAGAAREGAAHTPQPDASVSVSPPAAAKAAADAHPDAHPATEQGADAKPAGDAKTAPLPPPARPAAPKPISSIKTLVPHKPKRPLQEEGAPWGWIAAGATLLAAGAAVLAWRRLARSRRAAGAAGAPGTAGAATTAAPGAPGLLDKLKARFARPSSQAAQPAAASGNPARAEPTPE
ncbi:hypothetical protein HH212_01420 [Massilia forsythiae]|uniref:FimV N-terminal domain-containing protein n=1 Tax=Massilia forsythiae TaxID=2728020 RepID=A0A7Z2VTE5_9BURK|nr:hypothetical protein [Massilia forsythiae]QJD98865.1 hypothetical protein HH212_01420 [Massilia forsythiae]